MQKTLHIRTTVLPGGKIEIEDRDLSAGEEVEVVISPDSNEIGSFGLADHLGGAGPASLQDRQGGR